MPKIRLLYLLIIFQVLPLNQGFSQGAKTVIKSDFAIRDFNIFNDSIIFLKKRDIFLYNIETKSSKNYFIGGYGLKMNTYQNSNYIVSASNELVRNVSSVRFYNKKDNKFESVFYYKNGKMLDFLLIPEAKLFVLSLSNKKIVFIDYQKKTTFLKTIELNLSALSRKLIFKDNTLYFVTDNGEIFNYSLYNQKQELIYKTEELITDFIISDNILVYTTLSGQIVKLNLDSNNKELLSIKNNFVSTLIKYNTNKVICGSWTGEIYIINLNNFLIEKEFKFHNRAILKINKGKNNTIYSSSLDKTIKEWELN